MSSYRVVDIYELADIIADETDEEVLAALHILEQEGDNAFFLKESFLKTSVGEDIDFI